MSQKRAYQDGCAVAHALDIIGDRWAMPIMRELMLGPRRFTDLRAGLPGISANMLTQRLADLEAASILIRRRLPPPAASQIYELTDWGRESEILFQILGRWACRSPTMEPGKPMSQASVILSMRTMIDRSRIGDLNATIGLRFGEETFRATFQDGDVHIDRGDLTGADVVISGDQNALVAVLYGGARYDDMADALSIEGDRALADRFASLFPLPPKAPSTYGAD
ncbi:winged helix-turn-helix transcriptional regulator [Sphingobium sp. HBC34]|uniref:Winged helix-turn-helix transcriptional regulator n=1 Tax=Sphingobium cyanobacteriorum TaxID=3063954 RepID=A0ABT8ZIQ5_9SPHN|nr:winged helix-turn-helix transcriptional regulator [Sphingobium sp. HBC34]MDO7834023.1 winged helix-turn-helix transcriptional regulator [Sphingobium sp. HBC34]